MSRTGGAVVCEWKVVRSLLWDILINLQLQKPITSVNVINIQIIQPNGRARLGTRFGAVVRVRLGVEVALVWLAVAAQLTHLTPLFHAYQAMIGIVKHARVVVESFT